MPKTTILLLLYSARGACILSGVFFAVSVVERPLFVPAFGHESGRAAPVGEGPALPWAHYAQVFQARDVFRPAEAPGAGMGAGGPAFRVSGLLVSARRGVVLENLTAGQVLFLGEGERQGTVWVREISRDRVRLEVAGETVLLEMKGQM